MNTPRGRANGTKRRLLSPVNVTLGTSAGFTMLVRGLGLAGQVLLLTIFGAGIDVAGYFIALLLPQLVVVPIASAIETGVAPAYARLRAQDRGGVSGFRRRLIRYSFSVSVPLAIGAAVVAPFAVHLIAPGAQSGELSVAATVAPVIFASLAPQIVSAVAAGMLYGAGHYQAPIVAKGVNPLAIVTVLLLAPGTGIVGVAIASLVGSLVEAAILLWRLRTTEGPTSHADPGPELRPLLRSVGSLVLTYFVAQAVPVVDQAFVSSLGAAALATFVVALRFVDVGKAVAILPNTRMAQTRMALAAGAPPDEFRAHVRGEVRRAVIVGLLSACCLAVGGPIVVQLFFQHGEFTASDTAATVHLLLILAVVLVPASVAYTLPRALVVIERGSLYFALAVAQVVLNLVFDALLIGPFGAAGVAAASGVNFTLTSVLAWFLLSRSLDAPVPVGPLTPAGAS